MFTQHAWQRSTKFESSCRNGTSRPTAISRLAGAAPNASRAGAPSSSSSCPLSGSPNMASRGKKCASATSESSWISSHRYAKTASTLRRNFSPVLTSSSAGTRSVGWKWKRTGIEWSSRGTCAVASVMASSMPRSVASCSCTNTSSRCSCCSIGRRASSKASSSSKKKGFASAIGARRGKPRASHKLRTSAHKKS